MKLLIISAAFPPLHAGEADHALHLCEHLADHGVDVHVLTTQRQNIQTDGFRFKVYPLFRNWSWWELPRLVIGLKRLAPDAVMLLYSGWIYNDHPMITFAPTIVKTLLPRAPFVTQFHIMEGSYPSSIFTRALRKGITRWAGPQNVDYSFGTLLRDSDQISILSERFLAGFSDYPLDLRRKTVVIPPPPLIHICLEVDGVTRQRCRDTLGVKSNDFLIAYFGYLYPGKGVSTLLKALQIVTMQRPDVRLLMIGGGKGTSDTQSGPRSQLIRQHTQEMYELAGQLGICDKVLWTGGYTSDSHEASLYLHASDACVLPFDKGISLNNSTFAAAAAHGLPIITTMGQIVESPFMDQKNVLLCPPKDPKALAAAIDSLISSPELQQCLHTGALELADQWFSWDTVIARTMTTLQRHQ